MKYLFFVLIILAGCVPKPVGPLPPATQYYEYTQELPRNAQIIEDLGNGWIVYKVEVMGEIRWFKHRYTGDFAAGEAQTLSQTVTELRPPASYYNNVLK